MRPPHAINIRKGQTWRKKKTVHEKEFYAIIIGKGRGDGWKARCSDGDTHTFGRYALWKYFELC
jgi:hypothetical protein